MIDDDDARWVEPKKMNEEARIISDDVRKWNTRSMTKNERVF